MSYDAIYAATRQQIRACDSERAVSDAIKSCFDPGSLIPRLHEAVDIIRDSMTAPHVYMRPALSIDGDRWCATYGANMQDGVVGFGPSPAEAMADFDTNWHKRLETHP